MIDEPTRDHSAAAGEQLDHVLCIIDASALC
jgi:hypothetical protein